MLTSNIKTARTDIRSLIRDAQALFREATLNTGEKADELRSKGLELLDTAVEKAQEIQTVAVEKGKEVAHTTDDFVHHNPWKAAVLAAGVGMLAGLLITKR